uniref:MLO-like protein n=1 Tax=Auxenochlorella protothecoides TaxID=3075 RepID=A0A1D2A441_AUXPR
MTGGGSNAYTIEGLSDSLLETPTFTIALVYLFFLVLSVSFELLVNYADRLLDRKNRPGLKTGLRKLILELTLLGFVSLILTLLQGSLTKICVTYSPGLASWTLLENVNGCPCCLSPMHLSLCAQMDHNCLFNASSSDPYCDCANPDALENYITRTEEINSSTCVRYTDNEELFIGELFYSTMELLSNGLNLTTRQMCELYDSGALMDEIVQPGSASSKLPPGRRRLLQDDTFGLDQVNSDDPATGEHILPNVNSFKCQGPFLTGNCPAGQVPAISATTLVQIHLWIFLIAIFHVVCAVIMLLLAEWRLRQWRGWQTGDLLRSAALRRQQSLASFRREVAGLGVAHAVADTRVADQPPAEGEAGLGGVPTARPSSSSASQAGSENVLELQLGNGTPRDKGLRTAADVEGQPVGPPLSSFRHADTAPGTAPGTAPPGTAPSASPSSTSPGAPPPGEPRLRRQSLGETLQQLMQSKKRQWRRRDTVVRGHTSWLLEVVYCFFHAFWPNMVTHKDFLLLRASYMKTYEVMQPFDFVTLSQRCLELDASRVVGISIEMWLIVIVFILVSGLIGWLGSLYIILAAALTLAVNVSLVAAVRHRCRGGRANVMGRRRRWFRGPGLLTAAIRMVIFLCSLVFSTTVFFAWQFGHSGCFFTDEVDLFGFGSVVPWWVSLVVAFFLLAWVSMVTLPVYSMVLNAAPEDSLLGAELPFLKPESTLPGAPPRSASLTAAQLEGERQARREAESALEEERAVFARELAQLGRALEAERSGRSPPASPAAAGPPAA